MYYVVVNSDVLYMHFNHSLKNETRSNFFIMMKTN